MNKLDFVRKNGNTIPPNTLIDGKNTHRISFYDHNGNNVQKYININQVKAELFDEILPVIPGSLKEADCMVDAFKKFIYDVKKYIDSGIVNEEEIAKVLDILEKIKEIQSLRFE